MFIPRPRLTRQRLRLTRRNRFLHRRRTGSKALRSFRRTSAPGRGQKYTVTSLAVLGTGPVGAGTSPKLPSPALPYRVRHPTSHALTEGWGPQPHPRSRAGSRVPCSVRRQAPPTSGRAMRGHLTSTLTMFQVRTSAAPGPSLWLLARSRAKRGDWAMGAPPPRHPGYPGAPRRRPTLALVRGYGP